MKKLAGLIFIMLLVSGFGWNMGGERYISHEPVYMSWDELRSSIKLEVPKESKKRGKIYLYKNWILLNEPNKGIHIIDNTDKSDPIGIYFINIPGNVDMAVRNDRLYVDSFTDLVILNFEHPSKVKEISRRKDVFDYNPYQVTDTEMEIWGDAPEKEKGVVIDWIEVIE